MAWTYDPVNLAESKTHQVRFKLGDTVESDALLQDEEIDFLLQQTGNDVLRASIQGCLSIISVLSGLVDFRVGPYSESQGSRLKAYELLLAQLQAQVAGFQPPMANAPTTTPVFHYDMMTTEGFNHE
jgi:hypothetical protein